MAGREDRRTGQKPLTQGKAPYHNIGHNDDHEDRCDLPEVQACVFVVCFFV
jgi:hypothetical protein